LSSQAQQALPVIDPDNVAEVLCDGMFNVHVVGPFAHLTFTQIRPEPGPMFANSALKRNFVVRARIVTTLDNLVALRDALARMTLDQGSSQPATAGGTRH
jgi:hypothetical protein